MMSLAPFHVLEDEIYIRYDRLYLRDGEGLTFSFLGTTPDWVEEGPFHWLQIHCQRMDHSAFVRLEAWEDAPSAQEELWDESCDLLIDWTSGAVDLVGSVEDISRQDFTFGSALPSLDYRLRISRRVIPKRDEDEERALAEGQESSHAPEHYLLQFWPVSSPRGAVRYEEEEFEADSSTPLSPRQIAILASLSQGKSDDEVAKELQVGWREIKTSMDAIIHKLGVNDRTAAVVYALRQGWIPLISDDQELTPVTPTFQDVTRDGKPDMPITAGDTRSIEINENAAFRPLRADE
jgi:DNA-binding CsgD family transcriptional regulator